MATFHDETGETMTLDRRQLLATLATGAASARLLSFPSPAAAGAPGAAALRRSDGSVDWRAVRAEFDGLAPDWIHLSGFLFVSHPRPLRAEIERFRTLLDSDPYWVEEAIYDGMHGQPYEQSRQAIARYVGGLPEEICFTGNTTTAIAVFYHGVPIRPDQEILTTEHDHYVHHVAIDYSCARSGAKSRRIALWDRSSNADADEIAQRIARAITPKTRVVGVTWVQSSTGAKLPIERIAEVVARANRGRAEADRCLLMVDGVHGFGNQDVDVAKMGADFFAAGTHKWLFGPRGTGMLWGRKELWPAMRPLVPSFDGASVEPYVAWEQGRAAGPTTAADASPGGFVAYEHFFGLAKAVEFHETIGRAAIAARIAELNHRIREGIARIPGVTLHTPRKPELAAGINCFEVAGVGTLDVVARLVGKKIRATASPYRVSYPRFSAGIMNEPEEIDRALAALRDLARG
ncbi:MAG: aminotransferase class V-fold PLP-dependent enzyme [Thermoanaerobaculia bacterium]